MRISTTLIESFRLFLSADWMEEADLIKSIRGEFIQTKPMRMGTAFHSILEKPEAHVLALGDAYVCDGFTFPGEVVRPCLALIDHAGIFEVKATKLYRVPGLAEPVTVVAKVDQLLGSRVIENKTKWSAFEFDRYAESYQWRFYADIFEPSCVTYNVFCLDENAAGEIVFKSADTFNLFRYPGLAADCHELLARFVEFVRERGLERYLQPRVAA